MGGIYIKGMEMPTACGKCKIKNAIKCNRWELVRSVLLDRHRDCPLVPVPPHGRLGDLDELHKEAVRRSEKAGTHDIWYNCADRVICALDIKNAPTIIPAEPEEEEIK